MVDEPERAGVRRGRLEQGKPVCFRSGARVLMGSNDRFSPIVEATGDKDAPTDPSCAAELELVFVQVDGR